ncbi:MAG: sugar ABC transporter substrate-binding protein [Desulfitobacteriaceae bacterium]
MRKYIKVIAVLLSLTLILAGCGTSTSSNTNTNTGDSGKSKELSLDFNGRNLTAADVFKLGEIPGLGIVHTNKKGLKIGMTVSSLEFPVFGTMRDFAKILAESDGNQFIFVNGENDIAKQDAAIDNFITQKCDVVIINAVNPPAQLKSLDKLYNAGIKVVALDRAFDSDKVHHVLGDDEQEGRNAADTIAKALNNKGNVVEVTGQPGVSHANDNARGFADELKKYPDIHLVANQSGNYQRDKSFSVMQDILNSHPAGSIQAVFAHNDNSALGALAAVESAGRTKEMIVIGGDADKDALKAIKEGRMYGSDDRSPSIMGATAYEVAAQMLNGDSDKLPYAMLIPPVMITKDTMDRANDPFLALEQHSKKVIKTLQDYKTREQ